MNASMREQIGRVLYEEPGYEREWSSLSEERREPWRADADRVLAIFEPPATDLLREALSELVDLMQGVIDGDYKPDSFTLQPARSALATHTPEAEHE